MINDQEFINDIFIFYSILHQLAYRYILSAIPDDGEQTTHQI